MRFEAMAEFELNIQLDRLKYIDTLLHRRAFCDFPPRKIYIEPTNVCNLRCVHCVHDGAMTRGPGYFNLDLYKDMVDQIGHLALHTKLQFTGVGEPFFHKQIFEMIRYASERGFFTLMNTNATILTRERAEELVDSGLDYLHVSLDGATAKTCESIRKGASFAKVVENILTLFEVRHEKRGYHLAVVLGMVEQQRNRAEAAAFLKFFEPWPFHHVVSGELFNHMGAVEKANQANAHKDNIPRAEHPTCNTPWDLLSFNCDGQAVGCNYDYDNRYVIGDAHDTPVLDIWNGTRMLAFRENLLLHDYEPMEGNGPLCSRCTIKWQKDYHIPQTFADEVTRMENYLVRAIRRCTTHVERNAEFRESEKALLARRDTILRELEELG